MQKKIPLYIISFLLIFACSDPNPITLKTQIKTILELQQGAASTSLASNLIQLQKATKIIESNSNIPDSLQAENNFLLGKYFRANGNLDSAAIYFYNASAFITDDIKNDRQRDYFYQLWYAYRSLEQFGDCFATSKKFKSLIKNKNDYKNLAFYYFFETNTYKSLKKFDVAIENNALRIENLELLNDTLTIIRAKITQASLTYYKGDVQKTFSILQNLIKNDAKFNISFDCKRQLYGNYGMFLFLQGQYKRAKENYIKALNNTKKIEYFTNKKPHIASLYANIAEANIELYNYKDANIYLDSIKLIGINSIDRRTQKNMLKYQLRLASKTDNDISNLLENLNDIFKYQDEKYADKYNKELVSLSKALENEKFLLREKQESEIKNLQLKYWFLSAILSLLILIISGFLFHRQRKFKFEKQNLQMQQRLLRSQMNPHFTFNTLYAIQNLIKKDPEKSTKYLLKFSRLLRLILDNSINNYVQIEQELDSLRKYMDLQLLRFPNKFEYKFILEGLEKDDLLFIPPMLLQPFVENSIEHGFAGIDYLGNITIELSLKKRFIQCTISDNGKGLPTQPQSKKSTSTLLISDFIEKLTKKKIVTINKQDIDPNQSGWITKFLIPYKLSKYD